MLNNKSNPLNYMMTIRNRKKSFDAFLAVTRVCDLSNGAQVTPL